MKTYRSVLHLIVFLTLVFFGVYYFSNDTFACDSCGGAGNTWCEGGNKYECKSCGLTCPPGGNTYCWQRNGPSCDTSCTSSMHTYSERVGSCCETTSPDTPALVSPANGATVGAPITFDWNDIVGWGEQCSDPTTNDVYNFVIGTTNTPWNSAVATADIARGTTLYSWNGSGATPGTTYYWSVRADNGPNEGSWGIVRSFLYNRPPTCTDLTGPLSVDEGGTAYFNMLGSDPDGDNMALAWSDTCGNGGFPTVTTIVVNARTYKSGPVPPSRYAQMRLSVWDSAGTRHLGGAAGVASECLWNTTETYQTYTCTLEGGMKISQIGVQMMNDYWVAGPPSANVDLGVRWIEYDGTQLLAAVQNLNGTYNIMDRSSPNAFDGLALTTSAANWTTGEWGFWWNSALKFALPWKAPTNGTTSCTLSVTPRDTYGAVGNTCTQDVQVKYYRPVTGQIRDVTGGLSCATGKPITASLIDSSTPVSVTVADISGPFSATSPVNSAATYTVPNVPLAPVAKRISTNSFRPAGLPNFTYQLACIQAVPPASGGYITPGTNAGGFNAAYTSGTTTPNVVNLGYILNSTGWFAAMNGDVFAGQNSGFSISTGIPDAADLAAGWSGNLIENAGFVFGNAGLSVKNPSGEARFTDAGGSAEDVASGTTWPPSYEYTPPVGAITLSGAANCTGGNAFRAINPSNVYQMTASCASEAIARLSIYTTTTQGVAVVYVTDDGDDLVIDTQFRSSTAGRILFVSQVPVIFASTLSSGDVPPTTDALVHASFLTDESITFESNGTSTDSTVIVEGPLVVGGTGSGTVNFNRDRGFSNQYPGSLVKYNLNYLVKLTQQERQYSPPINYTGLAVIDVIIGNSQ